jgi:hypothetical protein
VAPQPITLDSAGRGQATGTTAAALDDLAASCGGAGQGDVVYRVTTVTTGVLTLTVTPVAGSALTPVVSVRSACAVANSEVAGSCAAAQAASAPAQAVLTVLPPGDWFVVVDSAGGAGGFVLDVSFSTSTGASCPTALSLNAALTAPLTVAGSTVGLPAMTGGTCGGTGATASEFVYTFTTTDVRDLRVRVDSRSGTYQPVVYLRSGCAGPQLQCATSPGGMMGPVTLDRGALPAGTYFLIVDGAANSQGPYTLSIELAPPQAGDACAAPLPLPLDGGVAHLAGDTRAYFNDFNASCVGTTAPDVVYSFTTTQPWDFTASVSATADAGFLPGVVLRGSPCATGQELACSVTSATVPQAQVRRGSLPAGTYFVVVDGFQGAAGAYSLDVGLSASAPGENCATPLPLTLSDGADGGVATVMGTNATAFNDMQGGCGGSSPEVVYRFTTARTLNFRATISPDAGYQPAVYLRSDAQCVTGPDVVCHRGTTGTPTTFSQPALAAGTYDLVVDGIGNTVGGYSLDVSLLPPPQGDVCAAPLPLSFTGTTATATGRLSDFTNNGSAGNCGGAQGSDAVYAFTLMAAAQVTVTVAPQASPAYQPAVALQSACGMTNVACGFAPMPGGNATIGATMLQPGTYFVWVDGANGTTGDYTLTVTAN